MKEFHYILQKEIVKDLEIPCEFSHTVFSAEDDWKQLLNNLEQTVEGQPVLFASIPVARYIRKNLQKLSSGLILPAEGFSESVLFWNQYTTMLPTNWLLNHDCIILPFGSVKNHITKIERTYGNRIFIKPVSPWKTFTGFDCTAHNINHEISSLRQSEKVLDGELVLVTGYKVIDPVEYRCWCIDGRVVTSSAYSWSQIDTSPIPQSAIKLAEDVADFMSMRENAVVIDIGMESGEAKVIEMNAITTSGWYSGMSTPGLLESLKGLYQ